MKLQKGRANLCIEIDKREGESRAKMATLETETQPQYSGTPETKAGWPCEEHRHLPTLLLPFLGNQSVMICGLFYKLNSLVTLETAFFFFFLKRESLEYVRAETGQSVQALKCNLSLSWSVATPKSQC